MNETAPLKTPNGHTFEASSLLQKPPVDSRPNTHPGAPSDHGDAAADTIACICGFEDDDGYTVCCDNCNRWQHQLCYYPHYEHQSLPEQHFCVNCRPQEGIDAQRARDRQRARREEQRLLANGSKRQPSKSHKKKVKDVPYVNGWPLDKARNDRNSASPRDLPPPAKRPKTSHRTSDPLTSASTSTKGHARRRTLTGVNHNRSPSSSPELFPDLYSEEFIRCYREDDWAVTDANLHDSIAIANALSAWLNASEEDFRETHGQDKGEVLMRWDGKLEDIPGKAQLEITEAQDDRFSADASGSPTWKTVTVKESVAGGAYIGELKGHVGFKDEYQQDPSSRWPHLRHPEPFVFFHPRLPIYIDARNEGTELRYVRRSCRPNAKLQILVTGGTTYHFCFMAEKQIDPGMEIAISWDTAESVPQIMRRGENTFSQKDMLQLSSWVSTVLANCGPCACQQYEQPCLMARFDRRRESLDHQDDAPSIKGPKSKKRKNGVHISPLDTNFNSRSGSEARKVDPDDEGSDSRSASGSAGRGSASRDITPNTHYSHTGSMLPELSERERKKLAKEEEMFRRQEEEQGGKHGKKKRNSGGSSLNTPSATTSRQIGYGASSKYTDAGTSKQSGLPSAKPGRKPKSLSTHKAQIRTVYKSVKRPATDYVDSETQCDMDKEEAEKRAEKSPQQRRQFMSITQRLLHRCALNNARRRGPAAAKLPCIEDMMDTEGSNSLAPAELKLEGHGSSGALDAVMTDVGTAPPETSPSNPAAPESSDISTGNGVSKGQDPGMPPPSSTLDPAPAALKEPPPPSPWPSQVAHSARVSGDSPANPANPDLRLQMPPPASNPFALSSLPSGTPTPTNLTGALIQSPGVFTGPSILSPSVTAAVAPSPAKKKMSLSDYTKRNKVKDKEPDTKPERDSSPASVASGPIVPPLQASDSTKAAAEDSAVVEEDVKMEDVGDSTAAAGTMA